MKRFIARALCACLFVVVAPRAAADDPTLAQAIDAALAGNPALQAFTFRLREQDAKFAQAGLRPAPELGFEAENLLGSGATRGMRSAEFTLSLSQVVELGGKRDARREVAAAQRGTLDNERQAQQLDVLAEVTRRFITVATRQAQQQMLDDAVRLAERTAAGAERRVRAAKSPHAELDRARIALDRAGLDARRAASQFDTAKRRLAAIWGARQTVIDGRVFDAVRADLFQLPDVADFEPLAERLEANPDLLRFASDARLRDAELRLAVAERAPDIGVAGGLRRLQDGDDTALVASLSVPLFGARRAQPQLAAAHAARDLLDVERRGAQLDARTVLYALHHDLAAAVLDAETLRDDILPRASEALQETEYAYQRGRYGYVELADAQREYLALQAALIEASSNAHGFAIEIERLTGAPLGAAGALP